MSEKHTHCDAVMSEKSNRAVTAAEIVPELDCSEVNRKSLTSAQAAVSQEKAKSQHPACEPLGSNTTGDAPAKIIDPELDIQSEQFNPLRALYEDSFAITTRRPKVIYQNLAALEVAYNRGGFWNLNKRNPPIATEGAGGSRKHSVVQVAEVEFVRQFQPHQMTIHKPRAQRHQRNLLSQMEQIEGPLSILYKCLSKQTRISVKVRSEQDIKGSLVGYVVAFDKYWNLLMKDVDEKWRRRKFKYGENKICGTPQDCTLRLQRLGIELPQQRTTNLNRKNVEIQRHAAQLLVRGEQIALISILNDVR